MRIVFVRHGEPDYAKDCLTEVGRLQAEWAAQRLLREQVTQIWSSPLGRARQTAAFFAEKAGLPVRLMPFMPEVEWGAKGERELPEGGHPWKLSDALVREEGVQAAVGRWREHPYFRDNRFTDNYDAIARGADEWLAAYGIVRQKDLYMREKDCRETAAVFSHGGSSACMMAHLLGLSPVYMFAVMTFDFTSVSVLSFPEGMGPCAARLELFNDLAHRQDIIRNAVCER